MYLVHIFVSDFSKGSSDHINLLIWYCPIEVKKKEEGNHNCFWIFTGPLSNLKAIMSITRCQWAYIYIYIYIYDFKLDAPSKTIVNTVKTGVDITKNGVNMVKIGVNIVKTRKNPVKTGWNTVNAK